MNINILTIVVDSTFIAITITIFVLFLYICLTGYCIFQCYYFNKKLENKAKELIIICNEKLSLITAIEEYIKKENIDIELLDLSIIENRIKNNDCLNLYNELYYSFLVLYKNLERRNLENINLNMYYSLHEENDDQYHQVIEDYSSLLLGYNYWTKFLLCRPFILLFRFKKKELII